MTLFGKLCVTALVWTIGGTVAFWGILFRYVLHVGLLDPVNRRAVVSDFLKLCSKEVNGEIENTSVTAKQESRTDISWLWMIQVGIIWPCSIPMMVDAAKTSYARLKDEYDRGIRTRKELS